MATTLQDIARNAAANGVVDLLDGGDVQFRGAAEAVVGTVGLGTPAFGAAGAVGPAGVGSEPASPGKAYMNATTADPAANGGPVTHAVFRNSLAAEVFRVTVTDTGGGGDIILTELNFTGSELRLDSFSYTQPAS